MTTLTLDQSSRALAVLAWRKGMVRKRFYSLAVVHNMSKQIRILDRQSRSLTAKQAYGMKKR